MHIVKQTFCFLPTLLTGVLLAIIIGCETPQRQVLYISGDDDGELSDWLISEGFALQHISDPANSIHELPDEASLLVLAPGYPKQQVDLPEVFFEVATEKKIKLYLEFPLRVPEISLEKKVLQTRLERGVVTSGVFGADLPPMKIMGINDCHIIPSDARDPLIVLAKVAGLDHAPYGLEGVSQYPLLVNQGDHLYAFTKLSNFASGRYGPEDHWKTLWSYIIQKIAGKKEFTFEHWPRYLEPSFDEQTELTYEDKKTSVRKGVDWFYKGRFFIHPSWEDTWLRYQSDGTNPVGPPIGNDAPNGDGTLGLLEGHSSNIYYDGSQQYRYWIRADVQGEAAYALAAAAKLLEDQSYTTPAKNLIDYIFRSNLRSGPRSNPDSAAYGLIGWSHTHPGVYYGDDNARAILGILGASAHMDSDQWDQEMVEAILANFRTTGTLGFRKNRLEQRDVQRNGWKYYWNREEVNPAPHFESWMWALYLWLYDKTGHEPLLTKAKSAIKITMDGYPEEWLWTNGIQQERARMILPLAWLVRIEDTPEHREWLDRIVSKLLENQMDNGAIREELGGEGKGRYGRTKSNAEYGLHEAPLIFENGDPIADMLYTSNFAFFSLNEAAHATGNPKYEEALIKLSDFLTRIQVKSDRFEDLDGAWFRAFDYGRWEFWASNADVGWGAWGTLSGWTQSWIVATQVLVLQDKSYWELTANSAVSQHFSKTYNLMFEK